MSKESKAQKSPQVKQKTRRLIPAGAAITLADIRKLPKRSQGPKKNPLSKIKWAFRTYLEKCPGLTSTTKRVACFLVDWYRLRDGYARPPISRIAQELSIGITSVKRAVAALHDLGIIFVKSGGPTRRQGFGTVASRYVPNFQLVINRDTGEIIKNAKYEFAPLNAIRGAGDYAQNGPRGAYAQNGPRGDTLKPIRGAGDYAQNGPRYISTSAGANATPFASAGAAATASAAPHKKQSGSGVPMPWETDSVKVRYGRVDILVANLKSNLKNLIEGEGRQALHDLCKSEIFNFGKPRNWVFDEQRPKSGVPYGHIIINDDSRMVYFVEGGDSRIDLDNLKSSDLLVIEYRPSPATLTEVAAKLDAL